MNEKVESLHQEASATSQNQVAETTIKAQNPKLAAILEENKPDQWGRGYIHLYFCCLLIFLCSTMNGEYHYRTSSWTIFLMLIKAMTAL